jgi:hypothetical protein
MTNQTIIEAAKVALVGYETTAKDLIIEAAKEAGLVEEVARFLSLANIEVTRDLAHEALLKQFDRIAAPCVPRSCSTNGIILRMRPAAYDKSIGRRGCVPLKISDQAPTMLCNLGWRRNTTSMPARGQCDLTGEGCGLNQKSK